MLVFCTPERAEFWKENMRRTGLLGEKKTVTLLQSDTVTGKKVSFQCFIMHHV